MPRGLACSALIASPPIDRLPASLSSFLGRDPEVSEIREALEGSRLVTLTGAPGIGKTRLALEVAGDPRACSGEPAALVELARVADPLLVPRGIAAALSVQEVPGHTVTEALIAHLRKRRQLLVVDNCEHLVAACAEVVGALLAGCPELRVLATSREALSISGERVWHVPPLPVPDAKEAPVPEALLGYAGVTLFVERARAVVPEFALTSELAPAVAEIARRLDGIPLAIELAATRVEMLTPVEIARRLDDRFAVLTKGSRGGLPRHQTLQAALDWSHDLLSAPERALLRRLSVFVGGFCLEAADAVCADGDLEDSEVFDVLARLVSKSLVVADTANSRGRYRLLETIRAYAADRLEESGEAHASGEAHTRCYLTLAERAEPELTGPGQAQSFERLEAEHENLRFALLWSLGHGRSEWALRLGGALVLFWRVRCYFGTGRELLEAALAAADRDAAAEASRLRAKALWGLGFMAMMSRDPQGSEAALEESLSRFRDLGDARGCARALMLLGNGRQFQADPGVFGLFEESATLAREAGDAWCLAHALSLAGIERLARNDLEAARPLLEEGIAVARAAQDTQGLRVGLIGRGQVAVAQGDYGVAESSLQEVVALCRELGEDYAMAVGFEHLGALALGRGDLALARELLDEALALLPDMLSSTASVGPLLLMAAVAHRQGDPERARRLLEQVEEASTGGVYVGVLQLRAELALDDDDPGAARRWYEQAREVAGHIGDRAGIARALDGLGHLTRAAENTERAVALHHEALDLQRQIGDAPGIAASLEALAGIAGAMGRHAHAARLVGAAQALRDANGYARPPRLAARHGEDVALIRRALGAQGFEASVAQGARLSMDAVIAQVSKGRGRRGRPASGWASLTGAEKQVAMLVAEGLRNREIAERLFISTGTVKNHVSHIFSKLEVQGRVALAREVRRRQEQSPPAH